MLGVRRAAPVPEKQNLTALRQNPGNLMRKRGDKLRIGIEEGFLKRNALLNTFADQFVHSNQRSALHPIKSRGAAIVNLRLVSSRGCGGRPWCGTVSPRHRA